MDSKDVLNVCLILSFVLPLLFRSCWLIRWRARKDREALLSADRFCGCLLVFGDGGCLCIDGGLKSMTLLMPPSFSR